MDFEALTEEQLAEWEILVENAEKGPYSIFHSEMGFWHVVDAKAQLVLADLPQRLRDGETAALFADSIVAVPALIAEVRRLRDELARTQDMLRHVRAAGAEMAEKVRRPTNKVLAGVVVVPPSPQTARCYMAMPCLDYPCFFGMGETEAEAIERLQWRLDVLDDERRQAVTTRAERFRRAAEAMKGVRENG